MDLVAFVSCLAIRRFHFALVGALYDGGDMMVVVFCIVVRFEMKLDKSLL